MENGVADHRPDDYSVTETDGYSGDMLLSPKSVAVRNLKYFIKDSLKQGDLFNDSLNTDEDYVDTGANVGTPLLQAFVSTDVTVNDTVWMDGFSSPAATNWTKHGKTKEELSPPLKSLDITKNDQLWNKDLNMLDVPSDSDGTGSVSSNDTMIMMTSEEVRKNEEKIASNKAKFEEQPEQKSNILKKKKNVTFNLDNTDSNTNAKKKCVTFNLDESDGNTKSGKKSVSFNVDQTDGNAGSGPASKVKRVTFADSVVDNGEKKIEPVKQETQQNGPQLSAVERLAKNRIVTAAKNDANKKASPNFKRMNETLRKEMKKEDEKSSFSINDRLKLLTMSRKDRIAAMEKLNEAEKAKDQSKNQQPNEDAGRPDELVNNLGGDDDDDDEENEFGNSTYEMDDILDALDEDTSNESIKESVEPSQENGTAQSPPVSATIKDFVDHKDSYSTDNDVNKNVVNKSPQGPLKYPGTLYQQSDSNARGKSLSSSNIDYMKSVGAGGAKSSPKQQSEYATYAEIMNMLRDKARPKGLHNALLTSTLLRSSSTSSLASDTQSQGSISEFQKPQDVGAVDQTSRDDNHSDEMRARQQRHWYDDLDQDSNASGNELDNDGQRHPSDINDPKRDVEVLNKPYRGFLYSNKGDENPSGPSNLPVMSYLHLAGSNPYKSRQELKALQSMNESLTEYGTTKSSSDRTDHSSVGVQQSTNNEGHGDYPDNAQNRRPDTLSISSNSVPISNSIRKSPMSAETPPSQMVRHGSVSSNSGLPLEKQQHHLQHSTSPISDRKPSLTTPGSQNSMENIPNRSPNDAMRQYPLPPPGSSTGGNQQQQKQQVRAQNHPVIYDGKKPGGIRQLPAKKVQKQPQSRLGLRMLPAMTSQKTENKPLPARHLPAQGGNDSGTVVPARSPVIAEAHGPALLSQQLDAPSSTVRPPYSPSEGHSPVVRHSPSQLPQHSSHGSSGEKPDVLLSEPIQQQPYHTPPENRQSHQLPLESQPSNRRLSHHPTTPTSEVSPPRAPGDDSKTYQNISGPPPIAPPPLSTAAPPPYSRQLSSGKPQQPVNAKDSENPDITGASKTLDGMHHKEFQRTISSDNTRLPALVPHTPTAPTPSATGQQVSLGRRDSFQHSRSNIRPSVGYASSSKINEMYFGSSLRRNNLQQQEPQHLDQHQRKLQEDTVFQQHNQHHHQQLEEQHQPLHQQQPTQDQQHQYYQQPHPRLPSERQQQDSDQHHYQQEVQQQHHQQYESHYKQANPDRRHSNAATPNFRRQPSTTDAFNFDVQWTGPVSEKAPSTPVPDTTDLKRNIPVTAGNSSNRLSGGEFDRYGQQHQLYPQQQSYQQQQQANRQQQQPYHQQQPYQQQHQPYQQQQPYHQQPQPYHQQPQPYHQQPQPYHQQPQLYQQQQQAYQQQHQPHQRQQLHQQQYQEQQRNQEQQYPPYSSPEYHRNNAYNSLPEQSRERFDYNQQSYQHPYQNGPYDKQRSQNYYTGPGGGFQQSADAYDGNPLEIYGQAAVPKPKLIRKPSNAGTFIQVSVENPQVDIPKMPPDWERGAPEGASSSPRSSNDSDNHSPFFVDPSQRYGVKVSEL